MLYKDEWLSRYFKEGAYSYQHSNEDDLKNVDKGFIYAKLSSQDKAGYAYLIKNGFNLIEVSLLFEQQTPAVFQINPKLDVGFVYPEEAADVIAIAKKAFLFSRFHQDDHIPKSLANQIKADWVANYFCGKRGDCMIVARYNKKVVGFLMLVNKVTIDLIAISLDFQRMGIASALIAYANEKIGLLKAGTQLNNQSSIAMYQKSGFLLKQASYVLHNFLEKEIYETV